MATEKNEMLAKSNFPLRLDDIGVASVRLVACLKLTKFGEKRPL